MQLGSLIAFRSELQKIAGVSLDAGTRANMAGRAGLRPGVEFLPGGELPSNDPNQTNFVPKIAADDLEHKAYNKYKKLREPGGAALKGGIYGGFVGNLLEGAAGKSRVRAGALAGAGIGVADWIARGKARKWATKAKAKVKTAMMGSETFSPGRAKAQSSAVGSFQDKTIHKGSRLRPMKMGQNFAIPSDPAQ